MRIAVWQTDHSISRTVHDAVIVGLPNAESCDVCEGMNISSIGDINIGYGILRGMDNVFRACQKAGKPFIHIDKGYWKPGHFDGYYRISLNGTQQTFGLDQLKPDYERWEKLGVEVLPERNNGWRDLVCPPTPHVADFFGSYNLNVYNWCGNSNKAQIIRTKNSIKPLQDDLDECGSVTTFNSSVGWEALRQGIPVVSDATHSILGAYDKLMDFGWQKDYDARRWFFAVQAGLQLTLDEMRQGKFWPLIQNLMSSTSALTAVKQSLPMSPHIPYKDIPKHQFVLDTSSIVIYVKPDGSNGHGSLKARVANGVI